MIRATTREDWQLLRDVRLRALADAPRAFASTLELEQDFPESHWRQVAGSDDHHAAFVLEDDGRFEGLVRCFFTYEPGTVFLVNMWVAAHLRGRGNAQSLLERVVEWAEAHGARRVALSLEEVNWPARRLYEQNSFAVSPRPPRLPYTPGPGDVLVLVRELDA